MIMLFGALSAVGVELRAFFTTIEYSFFFAPALALNNFFLIDDYVGESLPDKSDGVWDLVQ
jgi:hypothetical protein